MKKTFTALIATLFSMNAFATTLLHVPIFVRDEDTDKIYSMDQVNGMLQKKGLKTFPEYFEFTDRDPGRIDYKSIQQTFADIDNELIKAGLPNFVQAAENVPAEYETATAKTCFVGDGTKVSGLSGSLGDLFYSDQMSFQGWKYKNQKETYDTGNDEEMESFLSEGSSLWKNWSPQSPNVLILNSIGDDGTDIQESVVSPCK